MGFNTSCDTTELWKKYILRRNQTIMLEKHLGIDTSIKAMRIVMKMMIDDDGQEEDKDEDDNDDDDDDDDDSSDGAMKKMMSTRIAIIIISKLAGW